MRGTTNRNDRGSSKDRARRKQWLLDTFGDGVVVLCSFGCGVQLSVETVTVDRYPISGVDGGRYVHGNIRPACGECNSREGSLMMWSRKVDNG